MFQLVLLNVNLHLYNAGAGARRWEERGIAAAGGVRQWEELYCIEIIIILYSYIVKSITQSLRLSAVCHALGSIAGLGQPLRSYAGLGHPFRSFRGVVLHAHSLMRLSKPFLPSW